MKPNNLLDRSWKLPKGNLFSLKKLNRTAAVVISPQKYDRMRNITVGEFTRFCHEVAINVSADFILYGDKDLLTLHPFQGIPIYKPTEYLGLVN